MRSTVFLAAVALCLGACEPEDMKSGIPPWHMWGNSQKIDVTSVGASGQGVTQQLLRISYGRPETWRFFLSANVLGGTATAGSLIVSFNTTLGIGRSQVTAPLGVFKWTFGGAIPQTIKFASTSLGPLVDDSQAGVPNLIDTVVAQDIQVQAQAVLATANGLTASVEVTALFAPESHVRPEWFAGQFSGGEDLGLAEGENLGGFGPVRWQR